MSELNTGEEEETHECEECGREFETEHGVAVHAGMVHKGEEDEEEEDENEEETSAPTQAEPDTASADKIVADGGDDEIKSLRDVEHTDELVRRYGADGHLFAYRDGEEHVVVSRGQEPGDKWTARVPAERTAVSQGEHLWTIPDNWERRFGIDEHMRRMDCYHIPETGVDVFITVSTNDHIVDCWYLIRSVGQLDVDVVSQLDRGELERLETRRWPADEVADDVGDALDRIAAHPDVWERRWTEDVEHYALDAFCSRLGTES